MIVSRSSANNLGKKRFDNILKKRWKAKGKERDMNNHCEMWKGFKRTEVDWGVFAYFWWKPWMTAWISQRGINNQSTTWAIAQTAANCQLDRSHSSCKTVSFQGCSLDKSDLGVWSWFLVGLDLISTICGFRANTLPVPTCVKVRLFVCMRCSTLCVWIFLATALALISSLEAGAFARERVRLAAAEREGERWTELLCLPSSATICFHFGVRQ